MIENNFSLLWGGLIGLSIALNSFFLQIWPRLSNRYFGVDTWRHLEAADFIRKNRTLPGVNQKYIFTETSDYPPLLRVIISFFSREIAEKYQWLFSPIFDLVHSYTVFLCAWILTKSIYGGIIAQITYMVSPLVVMENSSLTTRSFASFLSTLTFFSFMLFLVYDHYWIFFVGVFFGSLLILAHRFSLQAFIFLTIGMMIYLKSFFPLLFPVLSLTGAIVLSKGYSWRVLIGHFKMVEFWRRNIHNRYAHQVRGLFKKDEQQESGDVVFKIYNAIRKLPAVAVFSANPSCIISLGLCLLMIFGMEFNELSGLQNELFRLLIVWSAILTFVGVLIRQFQIFELIGEGERYQDSGMFPSALVTAQVALIAFNKGYFVPIVIILFAIWLAGLGVSLYLQRVVVCNDFDRSIRDELWDVFKIINNLPGEVRVMTIPLLLADSVMYFTKANVLSTDSSVAHLKYYKDFFPVIQIPIKEILNLYSIEYVVVNLNFVGLEELKLNTEFQVLYSKRFCLLKISQ